MEQAIHSATKWVLHIDYTFEEHANRYFRVQGGRVHHGAWSLALEYKNFVDGFSDHITYNERLFVMSRPRCFQKYSHIVGLSGSVGSDAERNFLRNVYNANFVQVPKFLTTCRNVTCHDAVPLGVHIKEDGDEQVQMICDEALRLHAKTPVLIIAKSRQHAATLSEKLQTLADTRGLRANDFIRPLTRSLYENNR